MRKRWPTLPRRIPSLWISVIKATVALTLTFILIFLHAWSSLNPHPLALNGAILVVVAGYAGKTVGGCLQTLLLGGAGLTSGVVVYVILAVLAHAPVAQGFVFALYVYGAALVRAGGPKFIAPYLYGILFAFNGIYAPITGSLTFDRSCLLACFQAYAWGMAIVLTVNLLVWPVTSEHELRKLLVASLQHVSTLAHLTCKTYAKEIDQDETEVRELLVQTIRSDYLALTARLEETSFEITYTKFTLRDWRDMIGRVQGLQQALITSSSALDLIDTLDPEGINVKRHLLARAESSTTFGAFRRGIDLVIVSIIDELLGPGVVLHRESEHHSPPLKSPLPSSPPAPGLKRQTTRETLVKLTTISARLRREVQKSEVRQQRSRQSSLHLSRRESAEVEGSGEGLREGDIEEGRIGVKEKGPVTTDVVEYFRAAWDSFAKAQADALIRLIRDGSLQVEDVLRIEAGMPSLQVMYAERLPKAWTSSLIGSTQLGRLQSRNTVQSSHDTTYEEPEVSPEDVPCSGALTKSYSLLFGLGQLTDELCTLHAIVMVQRPKGIRPYIFQTFVRSIRAWWVPRDDMTLPEALAALRGQVYQPPPLPLGIHLIRLEKWFRCDRSLYAAKVALGSSVYTVLLLAPSLQHRLFLKYGMTSSLITVIVAIAPTMGATFTTWLLQMTGTGLGSIYGLVVLEIFRNVGGYKYNPYGLTAAIAAWTAFSSYWFYKYPKYYTGSLLLMTGAGSMLVLEWLYNELPSVGQERDEPYDTPPQRLGHALASMCISIVISAVFQLFILRTPARRKLRLQIADVTFALSSYNTLLQSNINLVAPADDAPVPPPEALAKVQRELIKRESAIQAKILALGPTFEFAKAEPAFAAPFKGEVLLKIIRSHQIILDRLREARTAVGSQGFNDTVHRDFASALFPYRLHSQRLTRVLFHLAGTSLLSKTQLARDVPSSGPTWASFENDALVLSRRLSQLPRGEEELKRPGFLRYWFYLVSLGAVSSELELLEKYLGELFGLPEWAKYLY